MIASEREFLKVYEQIERLWDSIRRARAEDRPIDQVERAVFAELMQIGFHVLKAFVDSAGDGNLGETLDIPAPAESRAREPDAPPAEGRRTVRRLPQPHTRRYVSIFGELTITRVVYGTREGQRIEAAPLDARLGLPRGDFSYVLEDWQQRLCVKESFGEATGALAELLGVAPSVRAAEVMSRELAEFAPSFRQQQSPPPAAEEGELVVFTADGKGVPMRRPRSAAPRQGARRTKGQKANKKQMSYVGTVYTIDRFVRTAEDVVDELARKDVARARPRPQHKRVAAEMTQVLEGEECNGRVTLFGELSEEVQARNGGGHKPVVAVMDEARFKQPILRITHCVISFQFLFGLESHMKHRRSRSVSGVLEWKW